MQKITINKIRMIVVGWLGQLARLVMPQADPTIVPISNNDILWEVEVEKTDRVEYEKKVIRLKWGLWDDCHIDMMTDQAERLRDKLTEILKTLAA